jgi:hypothetical protein
VHRVVPPGLGLRQIVLRLRRPAARELDVDDGREAAPVQRLGGLLKHLRIRQGLLCRAECGVDTVDREIGTGHAEDQQLIGSRE